MGIYYLYEKLTAVWPKPVSLKVMRTLIMKLPYTEVKFYPKVISQTDLRSLRVSCKRASYFMQFGRLLQSNKGINKSNIGVNKKVYWKGFYSQNFFDRAKTSSLERRKPWKNLQNKDQLLTKFSLSSVFSDITNAIVKCIFRYNEHYCQVYFQI